MLNSFTASLCQAWDGYAGMGWICGHEDTNCEQAHQCGMQEFLSSDVACRHTGTIACQCSTGLLH